ncbi:GatB/YqeY domain-containing protein [Hypomontagnella monticulosa]|nr:GatB/YqeY domain-containing protein [Hypomontagnella monticulosa]
MAALRPSSRMAERLLLRTQLGFPATTSTNALSPLSRRCNVRFYSSDEPPPPPPLLQKIKADLKTAMRAKDAARLTAIRSVLSATLNASKTAAPIETDVQLVALIRRTQRASEDASAEFLAAGRQDLVDKEQAQVAVLEEYIAGSGIAPVTADELRAAVTEALAASGGVRAKMGDVLKFLLEPGGPLHGKDVQRAQIVKMVRDVVGVNDDRT